MDLFKRVKGNFYIIAICKGKTSPLKHEIAHGLYNTNKSYKKTVLSIIRKYNTSKLRKKLTATAGYHKAVLDDEVHAHACFPSKKFNSVIPKGLTEELQRVFNNYNKFI